MVLVESLLLLVADPTSRVRQELAGKSARPIRVLIFDEQSVVRAGLRVMLETCGGFDVVADAGDASTAISLAAGT